MRIIFMGTPDFSVLPLTSLLEAGHEVVAVYCQPPKPVGRGGKVQKTPVHTYAESKNIPVFTPKSFKSEDSLTQFKAHNADIAVVVAYGLLLPKAILEAPMKGCINIHASLLPRWRGAAPIQRAIEAGDKETGVCIMQMDEGLDTGPVLMEKRLAIGSQETGQSLHDKLSSLGAEMVVNALTGIENKTLTPTPQIEAGVTYAKKLSRHDAQLDWNDSADSIEQRLRAFTPWPGLFFSLEDGTRIKLLSATVEEAAGAAGITLDAELLVGCGENSLRITQLQKQGKKAVIAKDFLNGTTIAKGTSLALSPSESGSKN